MRRLCFRFLILKTPLLGKTAGKYLIAESTTPPLKIATIEETKSSPEEELGNKRLFVWFHDEIHEIKRGNKEVWIGRSPDCLATFTSRFVSRQHARLYFEDGAYYLADDSTNGTYIQNDDGETFITKGKVIVKGSGVISLGVPLDHSESDQIHFFIG